MSVMEVLVRDVSSCYTHFFPLGGEGYSPFPPVPPHSVLTIIAFSHLYSFCFPKIPSALMLPKFLLPVQSLRVLLSQKQYIIVQHQVSAPEDLLLFWFISPVQFNITQQRLLLVRQILRFLRYRQPLSSVRVRHHVFVL